MRRRSSTLYIFEERLAEEKARLVQKATGLKPGPEKDNLRNKIRQIDIAAHINEWLDSPGLQPPK
jgi:hypothetical protein